jgi:hypothetical protein
MNQMLRYMSDSLRLPVAGTRTTGSAHIWLVTITDNSR